MELTDFPAGRAIILGKLAQDFKEKSGALVHYERALNELFDRALNPADTESTDQRKSYNNLVLTDVPTDRAAIVRAIAANITNERNMKELIRLTGLLAYRTNATTSNPIEVGNISSNLQAVHDSMVGYNGFYGLILGVVNVWRRTAPQCLGGESQNL